MKKILILLSVFVFVDSSYCQTQLYICDGVWTNRLCGGNPTAVIDAPKRPEVNTEISVKRQKESILHNLRMRSIEAKRKYKFQFPIALVESYCLAESTGVNECRERVSQSEEKLDIRIVRAIRHLEREEKKAEDLAGDKNVVVVVEDQPVSGYYCRPNVVSYETECYPINLPDQFPPVNQGSNQPIFQPGPFSGTRGSPAAGFVGGGRR